MIAMKCAVYARPVLCALIAVAAVVTMAQGQQWPRADSAQLARGRDLVVGILAKGIWRAGGIIVGTRNDSIYVATVRHVIREAGGPDEVSVAFRFAENRVPARVRQVHDGKEANENDMALLAISRHDVPRFDAARLEFDRRGTPARLRSGDRVISIGYPSVGPWEVAPDERVLGVGTEISFLSQFVAKGKSGGALLNQWGEVTGMILLEEAIVPIGRALDIDTVLNQMRRWKAPIDLRKPTYPRWGYKLEIGAAALASEEAFYIEDRLPSGRLDLSAPLSRLLDWHVEIVRLAPENVALTAALAGLSINWRIRRLTASAFVDGGVGRTKARYDLGGVYFPGSEGLEYQGDWTRVDGFGFGGSTGVSLKLLVWPRTFVEVVGARWEFQTPVNSPELPRFFFGAGLRWALR